MMARAALDTPAGYRGRRRAAAGHPAGYAYPAICAEDPGTPSSAVPGISPLTAVRSPALAKNSPRGVGDPRREAPDRAIGPLCRQVSVPVRRLVIDAACGRLWSWRGCPGNPRGYHDPVQGWCPGHDHERDGQRRAQCGKRLQLPSRQPLRTRGQPRRAAPSRPVAQPSPSTGSCQYPNAPPPGRGDVPVCVRRHSG